MTGKEAFQIWAPAGKKWVDWVRPVPFVGTREHSKQYHLSRFIQLSENVPDKNDINRVDVSEEIYKNAAIIVDLPGAESVEEGIALAKAGYRPIPIYNGTIEPKGARATVDNQSVGAALMWGAWKLCEIEIKDDALPAFLLDRNRLNRFKMEESLFDNSWDIYPQDIPSAEYFLDNGIHKIIIIGESVSKDLKKILYGFQKKPIEIYLTKGYEAPKKVTIRRPLRKEKD